MVGSAEDILEDSLYLAPTRRHLKGKSGIVSLLNDNEFRRFDCYLNKYGSLVGPKTKLLKLCWVLLCSCVHR